MIEEESENLDKDIETYIPIWMGKCVAFLSLPDIDKKQENQTMMEPNNEVSSDRDCSSNEKILLGVIYGSVFQ